VNTKKRVKSNSGPSRTEKENYS